jgi:hypothetical protein
VQAWLEVAMAEQLLSECILDILYAVVLAANSDMPWIVNIWNIFCNIILLRWN